MRNWTRDLARISVMVLATAVLASCRTRVAPDPGADPDKGDSPPIFAPIERRTFVDLPESSANTLTRAQKDEYDNGRRLVSHTRQRCAKGHHSYNETTQTSTCTRSVAVQITAVEGAKYITWNGGQRRPQLLAWLENLGDVETFDGVLPGGQSRYAIVVDTGMFAVTKTYSPGTRLPPAGTKAPRLVRVEFPGLARPRVMPAMITARESTYGYVFECHRYRQPFLSDVDFRPCSQKYGSISRGNSLGVAGGRLPILSASRILATSLVDVGGLFALDDPTWFSCTSGCCTSAYAD